LWTYDGCRNRTAQTVTAGTAPSNAVTIDPNTNRFTDPGYSYDSGGNMTADGLNSLVYDGENRHWKQDVKTDSSGTVEWTVKYRCKGNPRFLPLRATTTVTCK